MKYAQYIITTLAGIITGMILLATYQRITSNNVTTPLPPNTPPSGTPNKDGQVSVDFGGGKS